ncbi:MAG TPA: hydrogenase expression/formation protein HypE [Armatimonadota bacterium]|jgi:hydrogenase expression/formation protein HypE
METTDFALSCPLPIERYPHVLMAHGGGGRLMHDLIEKMIAPAFGGASPEARHDSATLEAGGVTLAFTTDSYVVRPLFFPGGDIGSMAVHGTVNDLAMSGARPLALSAGFILEEGLPMDTLWAIVRSMQAAAESVGVTIVTGDTKVVDRGKGDGIFINTAGIGLVEARAEISPRMVQEGDALILSGDVGRHGICIMAAREGLALETAVESDSASVSAAVMGLLASGVDVHCMRDLTRGGLASALTEIAGASRLGIHLDELAVPVRADVAAACEILGFDPLYVACEGRFAGFVPAEQADRAVDALRAHPVCAGACIAGRVEKAPAGTVVMRTRVGTSRIVDMLSGEQLPRIC